MSKYASDEKGPLYLVTSKFMRNRTREFLVNAKDASEARREWQYSNYTSSSSVRRATVDDVARLKAAK